MSNNDELDLLKWPEPLGPEWVLEHLAPEPGQESSFAVHHSGSLVARVNVTLVLGSEFEASYPAGLRDRLMTVTERGPAQAIQIASEFVMSVDRSCRRIVMACAEDDIESIARSEAAGYRFIVEVDTYSGSYALLAAEPDWVMEKSRNIDDIPTD